MPLGAQQSSKCMKFYEDYRRCNEENRFGRFFGVCNVQRWELEWCLDEEFQERKKNNAPIINGKRVERKDIPSKREYGDKH